MISNKYVFLLVFSVLNSCAFSTVQMADVVCEHANKLARTTAEG